MTKLIVEVLDASDLMPKDGQGSASPYVEVDFADQRQKTVTRHKDLNPQWNQKLAFDVPDPAGLADQTVTVTVFHDGGPPGTHFLGRVKISGACVPVNEEGGGVQRYPLDKRGMFSHIKGDIALKVYLADGEVGGGGGGGRVVEEEFSGGGGGGGGEGRKEVEEEVEEKKKKKKKGVFENLMDGISSTIGVTSRSTHHHSRHHHHIDSEEEEEEEADEIEKLKKKSGKHTVRTFHSIPAPSHQPPPPQSEPRVDYMRPAPPGPMYMQIPPAGPKKPDQYDLIETAPPLAARMRYRSSLVGGGYNPDKLGSTYDLVEQMHYLYVSVVKARDLPHTDPVTASSPDPYVEVRLGNYRGVTRHLESTHNPVWNQIFAFSKDRLQAHSLEIVVKSKDQIGKDDLIGRVAFDLTEIPVRVPPDSPLAPQWYRLEDRRGVKGGEIMLAVWVGTQGDEAFPEAWHSDAHSVNHRHLSNTRSKVYFSPKLYYLRVHVIEAQDLMPSERRPGMDSFVKVQVGGQVRATRPSPVRTTNPVWNEELMFVVSEPFEDYVVVSVEERVGPGKDEVLGRVIVPVRELPQRLDHHKVLESRWLNLLRPALAEEMAGEKMKMKMKFASKIHLRMTLDSGYHVLDESTHFSSDLQPSAKVLRKPGIGILELGILSARNLLPMKGGGETQLGTDPYCVAKYGNKWVRTRTLLNTLAPRWNEQYTWEVYDPCTVITVGVFDNCQLNNGNTNQRDTRIGKVRIRLSTLEIDKVYTHYYPLLVLTPTGLKNHGEVHLALRFTCTAWVNMVAQYGKPLLPKMHYIHPISVRHIDWLRHQAIQIVAARLSRAEPPLRREVVEYMLDVDYNMWSLRRSKANFFRIMSLLTVFTAGCRWLTDVCSWRNPFTTILVHVLFLILAFYPELILPTVFLYLAAIGLWNYRFRPRSPPHMDARLSRAEGAHPDELDEEFDPFPTRSSSEVVRMRYDRLRSVASRVQTVAGDLATQGERIQAVLGWRDPRATALFVFFAVVCAVVLYVTPFQVVAVLVGVYLLRHPRFRGKMPPVPVNFFKRLPSKADMML